MQLSPGGIMARSKYYSLDRINKILAQYKLLIGQRSNGKSFAVKYACLERAYKNKTKFVYLRRYDKNIKTNAVTAYFADMPIDKITKGEFTHVICDRGCLYFANYDLDQLKYIKGPEIGRAVALNVAEGYKSQAFVNYDRIIFEEFLTNKSYLEDEPVELMNIVSTIFRDNDGVVYLIGNTISRVCPYFSEWELKGTLNMKPGEIQTYAFHRTDVDGKDIETLIAVEMCESLGSPSRMIFGRSANAIASGHWEVYDKPKLPGKLEEFVVNYEIMIERQDFKFVMKLLTDPSNGGSFLYVYPYSGTRKIIRVLSDRFSTDPYTTYTLLNDDECECLIKQLLAQRKVCYSDNITGSDFEMLIGK